MRILGAATVWLRRIVDIALVTLILVVLAGVVLGKLVPLTGRETLAIGGQSMEPSIPLGSAVVVVPVDPASLVVGDVVSMRVAEANAIFTHRVEAVVDGASGRMVRTKGDANPEADPTLVPASAIIGRVELSIPFMGYLLALLSIPSGVIFVVGLAATLLAVAWLLESLEPLPIAPTAAPGTLQIAQRSAAVSVVAGPLGPTLPVLRPSTSAMVLQLVAPGTRTPLVRDPGGQPRPNAREQIARSRSVRNRRIRWRVGHRLSERSD